MLGDVSVTEAPPQARSSSGAREPVLYHYTTYQGLEGIVKSKALWCSKVQYLNDSSELKHGLEILAAECATMQRDHPELESVQSTVEQFRSVHYFICSFTEQGDLLSQWRGYSGTAGVAIEFSYAKLSSKAAQSGFSLQKCIYDANEKRRLTREYVERNLSQQTANRNPGVDLVQRFLRTALLFKNGSFSEENEWRLVSPITPSTDRGMKVRSTPTGLVPYFAFELGTGDRPLLSDKQPWRTHEDFCVTGVTVGPHKEQSLQLDAVGLLFETNDAYVKSLNMSSIPYRQF